MKKLIFFCAMVLLFSCEKLDETYCWDCVKVYFTEDRSDGYLDIRADTVVKCDYSEMDAQSFEKFFRIPPTPISTCGDVVRWVECVCEKR